MIISKLFYLYSVKIHSRNSNPSKPTEPKTNLKTQKFLPKFSDAQEIHSSTNSSINTKYSYLNSTQAKTLPINATY